MSEAKEARIRYSPNYRRASNEGLLFGGTEIVLKAGCGFAGAYIWCSDLYLNKEASRLRTTARGLRYEGRHQ
jgi:hypothetical protein